MSTIAATILPALAPAANATTQGSGSLSREGGSSLTSTNQAPLGSQLAAVVSLTSDSRARATSSGEGRKTDASFEKQASKDGISKEKSSGGGSRGRSGISVEA